MFRNFLTLLFTAFISLPSFGQEMNDSAMLAYKLKRMNLNFKHPKGYEQLKGIYPIYLPTKGGLKLIGSLDYKLKPIGSDDVRIGLILNSTDTSGWVTSKYYKYYDNNQLKVIKSIAGVPYSYENKDGPFPKLDREGIDPDKIRFFDTVRLKKYNAEYGGIANIALEKPYLEKYWKIKVLFFYKKSEGEVYQYYFYNDGVPIDKIIRKTAYMLTFRK